MILLDPPAWPAYGRLWSHLASDTDVAELHAFARRTGLPPRGFDGDHYDVPEERYDDLVAAGAVPVSGRELLLRLQASGLRLRHGKGERGVARARGLTFADGTTVDVDLVTRPRPVAARRVFGAITLVADAEGHQLLTWSDRRQEWSSPGGWREGDEEPEITAVREIAEETGLEVSPRALRPVGYERFTATGSSTLWQPGRDLIAVYSAELDVSRPVVRAEHPGQATPRWLAPDALESLSADRFWWPLVARVLGRDGYA